MGRKKHYKNPNKTDGEIKKEKKEKTVKKKTPVVEEKIEKLEEVKEPVKEEPKVEEKKKCKTGIKIWGVVMIVATAVLLIASLALVYRATRSPEAVFKKTITHYFNEMDKDAKLLEKYYFDIREQPFVLDADVKFSSNIEDLFDQEKEIKDLNLKGKLGFDYAESKLQLEGSVKGSSETITAKAFIENRKTYLETSFFDKLLDITENSDLYDEIKEFKSIFNYQTTLTDYNYKDYKYVSNSIRRAIIRSLDSEAMSSEKDTYEVLGEEIKGRKYTYTIDSKIASKMVKSIASRLLEDKDFSKRVAKMLDVDTDDIKDELKDLKDSAKDIELDEKIKISIYTRGFFNELGGIEFVVDKDEKAGYYTDGKNYEFRIIDSDDKFVATAEKEDDEYSVVGKFNGETVLKGTVREFIPQKIDFDFKIIDDDEEFNGKIYVEAECKDKKASYIFDTKIEYDDGNDTEYIKLEGTYSVTRVDKLEENSTKGAVDIEDVNEKDFMLKLKEVIDKDEKLKDLFGEALDEYIEGLDKYRDEDLNLLNIADTVAEGFLTKKESVAINEMEDIDLLVAITAPKRIVENTRYQTNCAQIEDAEYQTNCIEGPIGYPSKYGYDTGYTLDELVEIAEERFGRKIDVKKLTPYGKNTDGTPYYRPKRRDTRLTFIDENGEKRVYAQYLDSYYDIDIYKVVDYSNNGNIYTVHYECTDNDGGKFQYELTFEKLTDADVRELYIQDIRIISFKLV